MSIFTYLLENPGRVWSLLLEHMVIFGLSWSAAVVVGLGMAIMISRPWVNKRVAEAVISLTSASQSIPSIAVIAVVFLFTGIGMLPAVIALFLYSLVPIVFNAGSAFAGIDPALKEAARGMGMSPWQILWKVEIPVILPQLSSGVRTAATINIGTTTIASAVGAGGLGDLIFIGLRLINTSQIFAGAFPAAVLAVIVDFTLSKVERRVTSVGVLIDIQKHSQLS